MVKLSLVVVGVCAFLATSCLAETAARIEGQRFLVTFKTREFGPIEAIMRFSEDGLGLTGRSSSKAASLLHEMALTQWQGDTTLLLRLARLPDGTLSGTIHAPHRTGRIRLAISPSRMSGEVIDGPLAGEISGSPWQSDRPRRDYPVLLKAMDAILAQALYDPNQLRNPRFVRFRRLLGQVAMVAADDADLVFAFADGWDKAVFSHFGLQRVSRGEIVAEVDANSRPAVELRRLKSVAILRVNTFLGDRATEQFNTAFAALASKPPTALIVDLRATPGGSLSVRALIEGLVRAPDTLGWFVSGAWWRSNTKLPTPERLASEPVDHFDDPEAAGARLNSAGLLKVGIRGSRKSFAGPVFVLIDRETKSVAELAAAALKGLGRATLIGEPTAGEVLSADTIPLTEGFSLLLPLADYFDARLGRLEGKGVKPDIAVASKQALERALDLAETKH